MTRSPLILLLAGMGWSAQAQQFVEFNNSAATGISTNGTPGGAATGLISGPAGSYYFALYESPTATTVNGSPNAVIPTYDSAVGSFVFSDSNWEYLAATSSATSPGRLAGVQVVCDDYTAQFVVLGWSANIGSSISDLEDYLADPTMIDGGYGYVGESQVSGTLMPGPGGGSIPNIFSPNAPGIPSFVLGAVPLPEPTTLALAVLGSACWLARRLYSGKNVD